MLEDIHQTLSPLVRTYPCMQFLKKRCEMIQHRLLHYTGSAGLRDTMSTTPLPSYTSQHANSLLHPSSHNLLERSLWTPTNLSR